MQLDYYKGQKLHLFQGKEFLLLFYLSQIIFHILIYQGFEGDIISQKQLKKIKFLNLPKQKTSYEVTESHLFYQSFNLPNITLNFCIKE